ncbi:toprim domain-containing protein [Caballeronia sp. dw_276]|uniref:toprim domain-containing protein n=1 Tax=Caballeronia sp. dw_276 TaxID=2719795 RepID=UPI002102BD40|nr:toprim domain-containing protein [Caballeronia sp. dw_276]
MHGDRAYSALSHLDAGCSRFDWVRIGMAAKAAGVDETGWLDWCATGGNYGGERQCRSVWRSFKTNGGIGEGSLFRMAMESGWTDRSPRRIVHPIVRPPEPETNVRDNLAPNWLAFWESLAPVHGIGAEYLNARCCVIPPSDGDLRYTATLKHPTGHVGPGLVALVSDAISGEAISLHRTWINADGSKADVAPPRMLLGGHRKSGGVIRLWPHEAVTGGLGIAEGIETALSLANAYKPAWALIDAGNLAKFPTLGGIESLLIAADHDEAGGKAAIQCAEHWALAGREVRIAQAPNQGYDLNDLLRMAA